MYTIYASLKTVDKHVHNIDAANAGRYSIHAEESCVIRNDQNRTVSHVDRRNGWWFVKQL